MDILGIIFLLVVLTALGTFIYLIVKTAKGWGAVHVTSLFFLFFATWVFLYSSAGVLNTRVSWIKSHDTEKAKVEELSGKVEQVKYGDLLATNYDPESLNATLSSLARLTMDRGRVWREIKLQSVDDNGATYSLTAPATVQAPVAPPAEGVAPQNPNAESGPLPDKLVVYAFAEAQMDDGRIAPAKYLGEYIVDSVQGDAVKLKPTDPLSEYQAEASRNATSWALFELMPIDSHTAFSIVGSESTEKQLFGRMDQAELAKLLEVDPATLESTQGVYPNGVESDPNIRKAALLRSYLNDGLPTAEPLAPEFEWILIEFVKEHKIEVDSKDSRIATEGGFFDLSGRTVDARLKRADGDSEITFNPGERVVFWKLPAEALISQDIAKLIDRFYVRPLNDYQFGFREIRERVVRARQGIDLYTRENAIVDTTNKEGQEQIAFRQLERQQLDKDLAKFTEEKNFITSEAERYERELADINEKIKVAYRMIQEERANLVATAKGN